MGILEKSELPRTLPQVAVVLMAVRALGVPDSTGFNCCSSHSFASPPLTISRFRFMQPAYFPFFQSPLHSFVTQSIGVSSTLSVSSSALGRFPSQILLQEADQIISIFFAHLLTEMQVTIRESH